MTAMSAERDDAEHDDDGDGGGVDREDRAEQDLLGGAGRRARGRVEVEEQGGEPGRGAEHDAGRQVTAPTRCTPIELHGAGAEQADADEARERAEPEQKRTGTAGGRHVGQRVTGEGLAPHHGEDADDRRDDGDHARRSRRGRAPAALAKKPGSKSHVHGAQPIVRGSGDRGSRRSPGRARRRPGPGRGRWRTSTWWP